MSEMSQPQFFKYLDTRVQLALSKALAALAAVTSLEHHSATTNGVVIGPAGTIALTAPSFTPRTGNVRIIATGSCSGGTAVATDSVTYTLLRDGVQIPGSPEMLSDISTVGTANGSLSWDDTVTPNTAHTWALQAQITNGSGHTIEFPIGGGSAGGLASIILQELPG
ncbi:MAG: hypothetical protein ACRDNM_00175 [Gaiellaceae bacterium]